MKAMSNRLSASLETKLEGAIFFQKATGMSVRRCQEDKSRTFDLLKEDIAKMAGKNVFLSYKGIYCKSKISF